jgi:predicted XRE-type DNA-binding protein
MNYSKQGRITMKKHGYVEGTGNVYADLGVVNPQEARAKADLAHRIVDILEARKLTQVQAGKVLGVDQPKVSALKRGRLTDFSIERLVGFLLLLDHNVQITVTPQPHSSRKPPTLEVNAMGAVAAARR